MKTDASSEPILDPTFLFRFAQPLRHRQPIWTGEDRTWGEKYALQCFAGLDGRPPFAALYGAWSSQGLTFLVRVPNKREAPRCRADKVYESDGFRLWIDTRDTRNVRSASRFCHAFIFLPQGNGPRFLEPVAHTEWMTGRRSEVKPPTRPPAVRSKLLADGYELEAHIPAEALQGFDPEEHARLGFSYMICDREHRDNTQTLSVSPQFPITVDPSLWGTLELFPPGE